MTTTVGSQSSLYLSLIILSGNEETKHKRCASAKENGRCLSLELGWTTAVVGKNNLSRFRHHTLKPGDVIFKSDIMLINTGA
jgi:hypothetical protein